MILLKRFQEGTNCIYCGKLKDGYDAECQMGTFRGHVCLADIKRLMKVRAEITTESRQDSRPLFDQDHRP